MTAGVYLIEHVQGSKYVGSSNNIKRRIGAHISALRANRHHTIRLQRSWNKHEESEFTFRILEECSVEALIEREQYWIDELGPSFNSTLVASPGSHGCTMSTANRAKLSERSKTITRTPEWRARIAASNTGKVVSEETKKKISASKKGKPLIYSDEARARLGHRKGATVSDEIKASISEKNKEHWKTRSRKFSDETRARMSASQSLRWARERGEIS